jgi:hypothetical protein
MARRRPAWHVVRRADYRAGHFQITSAPTELPQKEFRSTDREHGRLWLCELLRDLVTDLGEPPSSLIRIKFKCRGRERPPPISIAL